MTDIGREAVELLRAAILLANRAWGEYAYTSPEAEVNEAMAAAVAALDRAEADKAAAGRLASAVAEGVYSDAIAGDTSRLSHHLRAALQEYDAAIRAQGGEA